MSKKSVSIICSKSDITTLNEFVNGNDARLAVKAKIILLAAEGYTSKEIAELLSERPNTVSLWRNRFAKEGIQGLMNRPRGHTKTEYGPLLPKRICSLMENEPPNGYDHWTGSLLSRELNIPIYTVWRYLKKSGIKLSEIADSRKTSFAATIDVPVELTLRADDIMAEKYKNNEKASLEFIARITTKDGRVIEKVVKMDDAIPDMDDFDLCTKDGFLKDFDVMEKSLIKARDSVTSGIAEKYLEESAKKNKKQEK